MDVGVQTFVLFPKVPDELKTNLGVEAYNPNGIVPRAIRLIKETYPDAVVVTDVALDPYSDQGHDGIVEDGKIINDATVNQLCKQVICQARAGADIVAPSDMMVRCVAVSVCMFRRIRIVVLTRMSCTFPFSHPTQHNRMVVSRPFVMRLIPRALPTFPSLPTLPSMLRPTTVLSVTHLILILDLATRRRISKIQPMVVRP